MDAGQWILVFLLVVAAAIGALIWWSGRIARRAERMAPRTGKFTQVTGGRIHWEDRGEGPPILFVHGLGGQLRNWTYDVVPRLEGAFRCIVIDRPGCGYSEREGDARADLREQARMVAEFLDREGIGPVLVAGHSLGGALALTLALEHPERVAGLALVAPLTHPMPDPPPAFRALTVASPFLRRALGRTLAAPMAERLAERTLAMIFAPEPVPEDFPVRGGSVLGLRGREFVAASADLTAVPAAVAAISARYEALETPGGVLYGEADEILPWQAQGEALTRRAGQLEWELLKGRGHMLPVTAGEETAAFIRRMARRAGLTGGA